MKPNPIFKSKPHRFWANVKLVSEQIGYSIRTRGDAPKVLRKYTLEDVKAVYAQEGLDGKFIDKEAAFFADVVAYLNYRADTLNTYVQPLFMNREEARQAHDAMVLTTGSTRIATMNKQKGDKKHPAYLASMVSLIAEKVVGSSGFVDDARRLAVITAQGIVEHAFSRRFDGAVPNLVNPKAVWEIKEYYGTTTFGSRVADGVYETLLDGFEIEEVRRSLGVDTKHYLFIDDRFTWWDCGRSYLCRMVDMLHTGHVDEIFFGREVTTEWETTLRALLATA